MALALISYRQYCQDTACVQSPERGPSESKSVGGGGGGSVVPGQGGGGRGPVSEASVTNVGCW